MSDQFSEKPQDPNLPSLPEFNPTSPPPLQLRQKGPSARRYALPAIAMVLVIGGLAWVPQFIPNWRPPPPPPPIDAKVLLEFPIKTAVWDKDYPDFARNYEKGAPGHFDFPFKNMTNQELEIGLLNRDCGCSNVQICFLAAAEWESYKKAILTDPMTAETKVGAWNWQPLPLDLDNTATKSVKVPANAVGLCRLDWGSRKEPGTRLRLSFDLWIQPVDKRRERLFEKFEVPVLMAYPVFVTPTRVDLRTLSARAKPTAEFTIWSATRDKLNLTFGNRNAEPLFVYETQALSPEECKELEGKLNKKEQEEKLNKAGEKAKVRSAACLKVTVHEQKAGKQLDQGPFYHEVPLLLSGEAPPNINPLVIGQVKWDIEVRHVDERGRINLKIFPARDGIAAVNAVTAFLWAKANVTLKHVGQEPSSLKVKLDKLETTGPKTKWRLEIHVPPDSIFGDLPPASAIILRTQGPAPRIIRIPVTGHGQS